MIEEKKLSLEAGEFIHTIANRLVDGSLHIENISEHRAQIIMEISNVLRYSSVDDVYAPLLSKEGFFISQHPRSTWIDIASRLIDASEDVSVSEVIKQACSG